MIKWGKSICELILWDLLRDFFLVRFAISVIKTLFSSSEGESNFCVGIHATWGTKHGYLPLSLQFLWGLLFAFKHYFVAKEPAHFLSFSFTAVTLDTGRSTGLLVKWLEWIHCCCCRLLLLLLLVGLRLRHQLMDLVCKRYFLCFTSAM